MSFQDLVSSGQKHFPDLQVKYKDQSSFMKLLGTLLFFNKSFMTDYTTTIGSTVYFPTESFVNSRPISASIVLLHELVHIHDAKKLSKPLFGFLYLTPQILALLCLLLFLVSWKLALPLMILFMLPIPSYFRMLFEKRAYLVSLYVIQKLSQKYTFNSTLSSEEAFMVEQFKGPGYYFSWPFSSIQKDFDNAVSKIQAGQRPYDDDIFDIIDELTPLL